jgi:CRP-like cAMP-binding protein
MPASILKPFGARLAAVGADPHVLTEIARCEVATAHVPGRSVRTGACGDFDVLLRGWAIRFRYLPDGTRHIVGLILPGDPCNIDAVEYGEDNFQIGTLTHCTFGCINGDAFRGLSRRSQAVHNAVTLLAMAENAMLREWTLVLARRTAPQKIAHLFCELQVRLSDVGAADPDGYPFPLTQAHLAELLGLTPVHVNRTLQAMRADRLVELNGQRLRVPSWQALATVADFNPDYLQLGQKRAA